LVGEDGGIEIKSRVAKFQVLTIVADEVPAEYINQIQTFLIVSGRSWCDFVQYSNGMPLFVKRVTPDAERQELIIGAIQAFESEVESVRADYKLKSAAFIQTDRVEFMADDVINASKGE
jgi:predicted phage-related endonuclease